MHHFCTQQRREVVLSAPALCARIQNLQAPRQQSPRSNAITLHPTPYTHHPTPYTLDARATVPGGARRRAAAVEGATVYPGRTPLVCHTCVSKQLKPTNDADTCAYPPAHMQLTTIIIHLGMPLSACRCCMLTGWLSRIQVGDAGMDVVGKGGAKGAGCCRRASVTETLSIPAW